MKRTLIAAAVLAVSSGSVFAQGWKDPFLYNSTVVTQDVALWGGVLLNGCVSVSNTIGAVVSNTQDTKVYGVSLTPPAPQGTYATGSVTTGFNNTKQSVDAGGSAHGSFTTTSFNASGGSQQFQESSGYAHGSQSSSVAGGGYQYSQQQAGIAGGFTSQQHSSGEHISAGGHLGGSISINPYFGSIHAQGGLSAGYNENGHSSSSGVAGGFSASEGSGQGSTYGYQASQGSGGQSFGEQSSGSSVSGSVQSNGFNSSWGVQAHNNTIDETTTGSVTTHFNGIPNGELTATVGGPGSPGSGSGVEGNVGINVTQGVDNAQSNDAALASIDLGNVFGNAQIFNTQSSSGYASINNFKVNASVGAGVLAGASGNIGVNVAAGVGNVQNNSLAAASSTISKTYSPFGGNNSGSAAMVASDQNDQTASMAFNGQFSGTASLASGALNGASGNIGVNIAGGAGNVQHNGLAIAAFSRN